MSVRAQGSGKTHTGQKRGHNEDNLLVDNALGLYVVADGMGGHAAGEVASLKTVEVIKAHVEAHRETLAAVTAGRQPLDEAITVAETAIQEACAAVYALAIETSGRAGMGCTCTLLLIVGHKGVMAHVGDSQLHMLRAGHVEQISQDHSMVAEFLRMGVLTPEQAKVSHYAHVLTRSVGTQPSVQVDTLAIDVLPGDRFLLCSDGLSDYLPELDSLSRTMTGNLTESTAELVQFANDAGGQDNITVVLVDIKEGPTTEQELPAISAVALLRRFEVLNGAPIFAGLRTSQLQRVVNACTVHNLPKGKSLIEEGTPCAEMYIVLEGKLEVTVGDQSIGLLNAGECIGETALLSPNLTCPATLIASEDTQILALHADLLQRLLLKKPRLGTKLLKRLGARATVAFRRAHKRLRAAGVGHDAAWDHPGELF